MHFPPVCPLAQFPLTPPCPGLYCSSIDVFEFGCRTLLLLCHSYDTRDIAHKQLRNSRWLKKEEFKHLMNPFAANPGRLAWVKVATALPMQSYQYSVCDLQCWPFLLWLIMAMAQMMTMRLMTIKMTLLLLLTATAVATTTTTTMTTTTIITSTIL